MPGGGEPRHQINGPGWREERGVHLWLLFQVISVIFSCCIFHMACLLNVEMVSQLKWIVTHFWHRQYWTLCWNEMIIDKSIEVNCTTLLKQTILDRPATELQLKCDRRAHHELAGEHWTNTVIKEIAFASRHLFHQSFCHAKCSLNSCSFFTRSGLRTPTF